MLYRITLYVPCKFESGWEAKPSFMVGTPRAVELEAAKLLPPAYETTYSARTTRHPFLKVENVKSKVVVGEWRYIETSIRYVLSCGDLGWCP